MATIDVTAESAAESAGEAGGEDPSRILQLRECYENFPINARPDPCLERDLRPGFLLPYLFEIDARTFGRWEYWMEAMGCWSVPERPIPQIDWLHFPHARTRKMLETALNAIPKHGSWQSMGGWEYFRFLLHWMLWGFGHPGYGEPEEPLGCEGASLRVYQVLNLGPWMLWPFDYLGLLLAENAYGKKQGFFPTPMQIGVTMASMLMGNTSEDLRTKTVCDPAVGTGRLLLAASNYSLRLYGCDIDATMCMATLVNGYLFCPWMAKPFPFLDSANLDPVQAEAVSDQIAALAPPHIAEQIGETEHDPNGAVMFEPIKKRRRKVEVTEGQGSLF